MAGLIVVCFAGNVQALDPNRAISDYVRDRWGNEEGFPGGAVYAIAQTADGYLWIGTERGLVRFDGLSFRMFDHTNSAALPAAPILDLMTDADGNLWIRPQSRNLLRYRDGVFQDVMSDIAMPAIAREHSGVSAMCRGPRGEALFAVRAVGVFRYDGGRFEKLANTSEHSNWLVISMVEMGDGKVWIGTRDAGLFFLSEGQLVSVTNGVPDRKVNCLLAAGGRELWVATDSGIVRQGAGAPAMTGSTAPLNHTQALAMLSDRQSNIWIGTSNGLLRLNANGLASLEASDRRSPRAVNTIFEDREGNLWIGGTQGLERLRDTAFMTYAVSSDPSSENSGAVYVDGEGRTWFAPASGGLFWQQGGQSGQVNIAGLDRDEIYSLAGSTGELWVGRRRGGLTRLKYRGGSFTATTYTQADGLAQDSVYAVHQSRDGSVWAGTVSGGLSRLKDGKFTTYTTAQGLPSNTITSILENPDGTMWFGTTNGLCALIQERWSIYNGLDGLPPGNVNCLIGDSSGMIWIGTDNGIAILSDGDIRIPREVPEALREAILGLAEDQNGRLWISTTNHVLRVERDRILSGVVAETDVREFGLADGLRGVKGVRRYRSVIRDAIGRIWLSTGSGLSVVDPRLVADRSTPALVQVEGVMADGSAVDLRGPVRISSARQRIIFSYAGLSLTVPERVRYRYKLDSFDQNWSEPVASREAVYTNLSPGSYRFRIIASNSDGLWNSAESTLQIEIEPVFWQTWWFRLSALMAIALAILVFYRMRVHHLAKQLNLRFEERLAERTRVAQDLHDTLLQGFLSASMQLHVAADHLPEGSSAKPLVSRVLDLMRQVIEEGRTALKGLRSPDGGAHDLAQSFSDIRQELALEAEVDYRVTVEGHFRPLHPVIRDEVYRIGREAVVNAFRHSRASAIEVVLEYGSKQLRVLVRDDGGGIDPQVLDTGREGHWGLSGMRERAEEIGARLRLFSAADAGTEVELFIPGHIAFETFPSDRRRWLARLRGRKPGAEKAEAKRQGK